MGDKAEAGTGKAATGDRIQAMGFKGDLFALCLGPLPQDPVIVGGAGGLELEAGLGLLVVEPVQGLFILPSVNG